MASNRRPLRAALAAVVVGVALALLAACGRPEPAAPPPAPAEVTADAVGHFCGMLLADHEGPKGQAFLAGRAQPLWFSSVRDTIAFLRLPAESRGVVAVYVNDMAKARHWDQPEPGAWVDAHAAWFVVDSAVHGGMGAPEAVPFSAEAAAVAFMQKNGGRVVRLGEIEDSYVLGPVELTPPPTGPASAAHGPAVASPAAVHAPSAASSAQAGQQP